MLCLWIFLLCFSVQIVLASPCEHGLVPETVARFDGSITIQDGQAEYWLDLPTFETIEKSFDELQVDVTTMRSAIGTSNTGPVLLEGLLHLTNVAIYSFSPQFEIQRQGNHFNLDLMGGHVVLPAANSNLISRRYRINVMDLNTLNYIRLMPSMSTYKILLVLNDKRFDLKRFQGIPIWLTFTATQCIEPPGITGRIGRSDTYHEITRGASDQVYPQVQSLIPENLPTNMHGTTSESLSHYSDLSNSANGRQAARSPVDEYSPSELRALIKSVKAVHGRESTWSSVIHDPFAESQATAIQPAQELYLENPHDQHLSLTTPAARNTALTNDDGVTVFQILGIYKMFIGIESPVYEFWSGPFLKAGNEILEFKVTLGKLGRRWGGKQVTSQADLEHIRCFIKLPMMKYGIPDSEIELKPVPPSLPLQSQIARALLYYYLNPHTITIVNRMKLSELEIVLRFDESSDVAVGSREKKVDKPYKFTAYASVRYGPIKGENGNAGMSSEL